MKAFRRIVLVVVLYSVLAGCAKKISSTTSSAGGRYTEDLSAVRPKTEVPKKDTTIQQTVNNGPRQSHYVEPKFAVNDKLDTVLDSISRFHLSRQFIEGFTIQVYSGRREDALVTKKQLNSLMPDLPSEIQFTEPIFRVKAGKYYNRIDAHKDFAQLKRYSPSAIIIPEKIPINN